MKIHTPHATRHTPHATRLRYLFCNLFALVVTAVVFVPPSTGAFDPTPPGGGGGPADPSPTPYQQIIEIQQDIFVEVLDCEWSESHAVLTVDAPLHEDFSIASGLTPCSLSFTLDVVMSSSIDFENSEIPFEDLETIEDNQYQLSVVFGWLTGPGSLSGVGALSFSGLVEETMVHRIVLLAVVSQQDMDDMWEMAFYRHFRALQQSCEVSPSPTPGQLADYDHCIDLANTRFDSVYDDLRTTTIIGGGIAVPGVIGICIVTGGVGCVVASVGGAIWSACQIVKSRQNNTAWREALNCCCSALQCQVNQGTQCSSPTECRDGSDWPSPCLPDLF